MLWLMFKLTMDSRNPRNSICYLGLWLTVVQVLWVFFRLEINEYNISFTWTLSEFQQVLIDALRMNRSQFPNSTAFQSYFWFWNEKQIPGRQSWAFFPATKIAPLVAPLTHTKEAGWEDVLLSTVLWLV